MHKVNCFMFKQSYATYFNFFCGRFGIVWCLKELRSLTCSKYVFRVRQTGFFKAPAYLHTNCGFCKRANQGCRYDKLELDRYGMKNKVTAGLLLIDKMLRPISYCVELYIAAVSL